MSISIREIITRRIVITPSARLDAFNAPELRSEVDRLLAEGVVNFVLDLSDVTFLDSSGMAVMVSLLKRARQAQGDVKLIMPTSEAAQRILKLTKFDRVFEPIPNIGAVTNGFSHPVQATAP